MASWSSRQHSSAVCRQCPPSSSSCRAAAACLTVCPDRSRCGRAMAALDVLCLVPLHAANLNKGLFGVIELQDMTCKPRVLPSMHGTHLQTDQQ